MITRRKLKKWGYSDSDIYLINHPEIDFRPCETLPIGLEPDTAAMWFWHSRQYIRNEIERSQKTKSRIFYCALIALITFLTTNGIIYAKNKNQEVNLDNLDDIEKYYSQLPKSMYKDLLKYYKEEIESLTLEDYVSIDKTKKLTR